MTASETAGPVARIRRFNRAVTTATGALDASFLGRGRPLGAARMLHALGAEGCEVGVARARLGLDSGLASRLLRGLEAEGLVETARHPEDGRRRIARPTARGRAEQRAYERLSDAHAGATLDSFGRAAPELLVAMDRLACALNRDRIAIRIADPAAPEARGCLERYYAELASRFDDGFEVALSRDPDAADMRPPRGAFLVADADGLPVACAGLKGGTDYAEVKRLWVAPAARGLGLAARMMGEIESQARALGVTWLRLDTNRALTEASALYRRLGWTEIDRFNDDPYAQLFFERRL